MLRIEKLSRHFGGLVAVDGVSLTVEPGERRAIIGPNGAGKTTLFNLVSGELAPSAGRIYFDDRDITGLQVYERARLGIGRTFQRNNLFAGLAVRENVRLAVQQRLGLAPRWLRPTGRFEELALETEQLLNNLDLAERAAEPVNRLSYGEQRQLEVALALATGPRALLLDEPTAGMSPAETVAISRTIQALPEEITLLIIEHDMDVVFKLADRVTVLHHGEIIADGTPEEVRADDRVMEVYLGVEGEDVDA